MQRTGQGVDIIFREMISSGKPYPQYHAYSEAVTLTIFSAIDDVNFVKFIASEQDKIQKMLPLPELMILRYLTDNKKIMLSEVQGLTQLPIAEARKSCNNLMRDGLVGLSGKEYMLTAKVYDAIKSDVEYTQDIVIRYVKAKSLIEEYLQSAKFITNEKIRELCGFTRQQARITLDKSQVQIAVTDNGIGISPSNLPHIFERMYQCDDSRLADGNGLGLAIVKELVIAHKGEIKVESIPSVGTTFIIMFRKVL